MFKIFKMLHHIGRYILVTNKVLNRVRVPMPRKAFYSKRIEIKSTFPKIYSVFISQSRDIYTNLAIEEWIYRNITFAKEKILMLWINEPCVVIGRHQNPWIESNPDWLEKEGIKLARRNSGGGTVYHDSGNLNLTFFTHRQDYNRKHNLNLIISALKKFGIKLEANERDDILLEKKKVSGTAAKIGGNKAYHHCSLLVKLDKTSMMKALEPNDELIFTSKSTKSTRSSVTCLNSNTNATIDDIIESIGNEYLLQCEKGSHSTGFNYINPVNYWFQGIDTLRSQFSSWDWIYGRTPPFSVQGSLKTSNSLVTYTCEIVKGKVESINYDTENFNVLDTLLNKPIDLKMLTHRKFFQK